MRDKEKLEEAYLKIKDLYSVAYKKYMKNKISGPATWIVENMYRITYAYEYICNHSNQKTELLENEIIKLSMLSEEIEKTLNRKTINYTKTKLYKKIESIIENIEYIESMYVKEEKKEINKDFVYEESRVNLSEKNKEAYLKIAKNYINYFLDTVNEESNYLGVDYIDLSRNKKNQLKYKTSPSNIAFVILSIISAADLNVIDEEKAKKILEKVVISIDKLDKKDGKLYNWYDVKTLCVENHFISTVDNGNLLASLYVLNSYLKFENSLVKKIIEEIKFSDLINKEKNTLAIGKENELSKNIYDRLMSESRLSFYLAIARNEISEEIWYKLKRERINETGAMYSWTGCAFEYFLPNIFFYTYKGTDIEASLKNCYLENVKYMTDNKLEAFGMCASAYPRKSKEKNYLYKEFGIPALRLRTDRYEDYTITSHASIMMAYINPERVLENLKTLENLGMNKKYGLVGSIDLDKRTKDRNGKYKIAKIYFTHNVGMSITSINNLLNENILKKRFFSNEIIEKNKYLLI